MPFCFLPHSLFFSPPPPFSFFNEILMTTSEKEKKTHIESEIRNHCGELPIYRLFRVLSWPTPLLNNWNRSSSSFFGFLWIVNGSVKVSNWGRKALEKKRKIIKNGAKRFEGCQKPLKWFWLKAIKAVEWKNEIFWGNWNGKRWTNREKKKFLT